MSLRRRTGTGASPQVDMVPLPRVPGQQEVTRLPFTNAPHLAGAWGTLSYLL